MDNNLISFITYVKNNDMYNDSVKYINTLNIPDGYKIELVPITNSSSIADAYNKGMKKASGKYKIYIHEDVFIINKDLIGDILDIFKNNDIGMIGLIGAKYLDTSAKLSNSEKFYNTEYDNTLDGKIILNNLRPTNESIIEVQALDGFFLATQYDLPWRDDLFKGNFIYDLAQVQEFKKSNYKTVLLNNEIPNVIHDCGISIIDDDKEYEKYRKIFLNEYSKSIFPLVSIMITAYNRPEYFKIALNSAIEQEYVNKEIIVLDNSTNDSVKDVMNSYNDYDFIHYFKNETELKVIDNFNKIISLTNSNYITFLMDDDVFHKDKLNKMMNYIINYPEISMVTSKRNTIDANGEIVLDTLENEKLFNTVTRLNKESVDAFLKIKIMNFLGETTTPLFKKDLLCNKKFGIYDNYQFTVVSDLVTWLYLINQGDVIYIPDTLSYFRIHDGQDQKRSFTKTNGYIELFYIYSKLIKNDKNNLSSEERTSVKRFINYIISGITIQNNSLIEIDLFIKALDNLE